MDQNHDKITQVAHRDHAKSVQIPSSNNHWALWKLVFGRFDCVVNDVEVDVDDAVDVDDVVDVDDEVDDEEVDDDVEDTNALSKCHCILCQSLQLHMFLDQKK